MFRAHFRELPHEARASLMPPRCSLGNPILRFLLAVAMVLMLGACGGMADEFLPNSSGKQLEITVQRALNAPPDLVTEHRANDRLRFARAMLASELPSDVEVLVGVSASRYGVYRFGSGWITRGDLYLGRHCVATETVEVRSSAPDVVAVGLVPDPTNPKRTLVKLRTLRPGKAQIGIQVSQVDKNSQRIGGLIEDSFVLRVAGSRKAEAFP